MAAVFSAELMKLRRSWMPAATVLTAIAGPVFAALAVWAVLTLEQSNVPVPQIDVTWSSFLVEGGSFTILLVFFAVMLACAYVFGREYQEGTLEILAAAPLRSSDIVFGKLAALLAWTAAVSAISFAASIVAGYAVGMGPLAAGDLWSAFGIHVQRTLVCFSGLPLVGWIAMRGRGLLLPATFGVTTVFAAVWLRSLPPARYIPYLMPAAGTPESGVAFPAASWILVVLTMVAGMAVSLWEMTTQDAV
ncbi:MAG: ABC transporter permease [Coriobacteriia bacterium]|nr:ABC transporter permease [Coriobacteriia bacterium]